MRLIDPAELDGRARYQLLTSLVVPRPIGWLSTFGPDEAPNLAPFSYFCALSASPLLVGVSIGHRRDGPKDSLVNIRRRGAFCANVVTVRHLEAMNATSLDAAPDVDEFEIAGLTAAVSSRVDAPYVSDAPAVLECRLHKEVDLGGAPNTLIIGEVVGLRLDPELPLLEGTYSVPAEALEPVGRLAGEAYALPGPIRTLRRPTLD